MGKGVGEGFKGQGSRCLSPHHLRLAAAFVAACHPTFVLSTTVVHVFLCVGDES